MVVAEKVIPEASTNVKGTSVFPPSNSEGGAAPVASLKIFRISRTMVMGDVS